MERETTIESINYEWVDDSTLMVTKIVREVTTMAEDELDSAIQNVDYSLAAVREQVDGLEREKAALETAKANQSPDPAGA